MEEDMWGDALAVYPHGLGDVEVNNPYSDILSSTVGCILRLRLVSGVSLSALEYT
jgi:hypothetical protein